MDGALAARLKTTSMVPPNGDDLRKVCLAFESVEVGQHMLAWATKYCLFPDDEVYIVHCLSKVRAPKPSYRLLPLTSAADDGQKCPSACRKFGKPIKQHMYDGLRVPHDLTICTAGPCILQYQCKSSDRTTLYAELWMLPLLIPILFMLWHRL